MDLPTAIARSCDTYFYGSATRSTRCPGPWPAAPEVGAPLWLRHGERERPRPSGAGPRPDDRLAAADVPEEPTRPELARSIELEARRLAQPRDRPGQPDRDAPPDGAVLRGDRERRQARDAAHAHGRRESERNLGADERHRPRHDRCKASTRPTSRSSSKVSTRARTTRSAPRPAYSATSRPDRRQDRHGAEDRSPSGLSRACRA